MKQQVIFQDLGRIDYKEAWDYQERLHKELVDRKMENRNLPVEEQTSQHHYLLFCEHPHVYTLGKSGKPNHLLIDDNGLKENSAEYFQINRGGDITYHGPGQIVGYPILDLDYFFTDIHKYLRYLEEAIIRTLKEYNIDAGRIEGLTGVWISGLPNPSKGGAFQPTDPAADQSNGSIPPLGGGGAPRKICAFGVRCSRWVTMHGFAFNVNTDLKYFGNIVPCGINDKAVTSMEKELGKTMDVEEVKEKVKKHLAEIFGMTFFLGSPAKERGENAVKFS